MSGETSSVGRVVAESIRAEGITHAFCVPGESYLGILDAFNEVPAVQIVTTHHEEGAGFMAHAMAQATGRTGVVLVTRAPGLTHLSIALHAASQDSVPMVAIVGQVGNASIGREAFQELDLVAMGRILGKGGLEIREPSRAAEIMGRAFYVAASGRPGPVVVSVPEDVANAAAAPTEASPQRIPVPSASASVVRDAADLLASANSLVVIAGGGVLRAGATDSLVRLADVLGCSVFTGFRRFDAFPNEHPCYAGNLPWLPPELKAPLRDAEVLVALGTRLGDFNSLGYMLPRPGQRLIQIDVAAESMSVMRSPDIAMLTDARVAVEGMLAALSAAPKRADLVQARQAAARDAHQRYLTASTARPANPSDGFVDLPDAIRTLRESLPLHAAITSDAGAFSAFLNRYFRWSRPGTFFGSTSGVMGYAVPAAIGAKLASPQQPVIAVAGDGGFAMTMSEIQTAVRLGLGGLVFVVFDNGTYGTIRLHQQRRFPGRHIGVDQGPTDFARVATGLGARSHRVTDSGEFGDALRAGIAADQPVVIHAITSPEQIDAWKS